MNKLIANEIWTAKPIGKALEVKNRSGDIVTNVVGLFPLGSFGFQMKCGGKFSGIIIIKWS